MPSWESPIVLQSDDRRQARDLLLASAHSTAFEIDISAGDQVTDLGFSMFDWSSSARTMISASTIQGGSVSMRGILS
jgi:hypothetical protein